MHDIKKSSKIRLLIEEINRKFSSLKLSDFDSISGELQENFDSAHFLSNL